MPNFTIIFNTEQRISNGQACASFPIEVTEIEEEKFSGENQDLKNQTTKLYKEEFGPILKAFSVRNIISDIILISIEKSRPKIPHLYLLGPMELFGQDNQLIKEILIAITHETDEQCNLIVKFTPLHSSLAQIISSYVGSDFFSLPQLPSLLANSEQANDNKSMHKITLKL